MVRWIRVSGKRHSMGSIIAQKLKFLTSQEGYTKNWKIQDPHDNIREITINIQR